MKASQRNNAITALYSAAHFCVDLCCAAAVFFAARSTNQGAVLFLLYNFCAFALQLPLGAVIDVKGYAPMFAVTGCLLLALGLFFDGLVCGLLLGLGNAAFHVGAGVDVLERSDNKASRLGIFVSPGALGVFLGGLWAGKLPFLSFALSGIMLVFAMLILKVCGKGKAADAAPFSLDKGGLLISAGLMAVVLLRSLGGMAMAFPWKTGNLAFAFTLCVVLGKTLGGIVGDKTGFKKTAALSLALSAVLFIFAEASPVAGLAAALLFNMTMPLTLCAAAKLFGAYKGTAFGLLTLGLFVGFLPSYGNLSLSGGITCTLLSLLSLLLLLPCLKKEDV